VEVNFAGAATQDPASGSASYAAGAFSVDDPEGDGPSITATAHAQTYYCHGNYPGSGKNASPTFGAASTAPCGSCHEASNTTVPASGTHKTARVGGNNNRSDLGQGVCLHPLPQRHCFRIRTVKLLNRRQVEACQRICGVGRSTSLIQGLLGRRPYSVATGTALPSNGRYQGPMERATISTVIALHRPRPAGRSRLTLLTIRPPRGAVPVSCGTCHKGDMGINFGNLMDSGSHTNISSTICGLPAILH